MSTAICGFSDDLRLADNPSLIEAAESQQLLCVYCADVRLAAHSEYDPAKLGPHRAAFPRQALRDLTIHRRDRGFNVLSQAQRHDRDAAFVTHWLPELLALPPALCHTPLLAPRADLERIDYPLLADPPPSWQRFYSEALSQ